MRYREIQTAVWLGDLEESSIERILADGYFDGTDPGGFEKRLDLNCNLFYASFSRDNPLRPNVNVRVFLSPVNSQWVVSDSPSIFDQRRLTGFVKQGL